MLQLILVAAVAGATASLLRAIRMGDRRAEIVVVSALVWGAIAAAAAGRMSTVAIGALLFYISDLTVARHRFVKPEFFNRAVGLPLHDAGQVLVALPV